MFFFIFRGVCVVSAGLAGFEDPPWVFDFYLGFGWTGRGDEVETRFGGDLAFGDGSAG
jgi:hypothetical protein